MHAIFNTIMTDTLQKKRENVKIAVLVMEKYLPIRERNHTNLEIPLYFEKAEQFVLFKNKQIPYIIYHVS